MIKSDGFGSAENLARFAGSLFIVGAVGDVDHRKIRHSLWEGRVHGFAISQPGLIDIVNDFLRAFLLADSAAGAQFFVDLARPLPDRHGEVADKSFHFLHFAPGQ